MTRFSQRPQNIWRDTNNAIIAGVCSGLAHYFGFPVTLVRIGAFLLLLTMPLIVIIGYSALAWYLPKRPTGLYENEAQEQRAHSIHRNPAQTLVLLRAKLTRLERKLRQMESYTASKNFDLKQKFRDL